MRTSASSPELLEITQALLPEMHGRKKVFRVNCGKI